MDGNIVLLHAGNNWKVCTLCIPKLFWESGENELKYWNKKQLVTKMRVEIIR